MTITNGDTLRLAVVWEYGLSDEQVNVWHFSVNDVPPTLAELHADIEEAVTWLYGSLLTYFSTQLVHNRIEIYNQSDMTPEVWIGAIPALDGDNAADPLPAGVTALLYARTPFSRVIGKKYLPTMTDDAVSGQVWTPGIREQLGFMANRWELGTVATNGTEFSPRIYRSSINVIVPIMNTNYSNIPAYQRRRKPGRGS